MEPQESQVITESQGNAWVCAGVCSMQGVRPTNEDAHILMCDWYQTQKPAALFAVLDGHGGAAVANHAALHLAEEFREELDSHGWVSEDARCGAAECAFLALDRRLVRELGAERVHNCGSTCITGVIWPEGDSSTGSGDSHYRLLLANLGDSRGILARGGGLIGETMDHKPDAPNEERRIREAGGEVITFCGLSTGPARVDGLLACARAFGDHCFKADASIPPEKQKVSPLPEIYEFTCLPGDVIILACDGVFDVLTSAEVAALVCNELPIGNSVAAADLAIVAKAVANEALKRGTMDNVTCLIVQPH